MNAIAWILSVFYFFNGQQISNQEFSNQADKFFKTYVSEKGVNYSAIKNNPSELNDLTTLIEAANISELSKNDKAAFYINSYNLLVIKSVVKNFPIEGPLKVDGFFDKIKHNVAGESLTLNDLENIKLRKDFGNNKIHFALVCAGKGCPPITNQAFFGNTLEARLTTLTKQALNSKDFIRVNNTNKKVEISQIFEWFQGDFGSSVGEVITYINKYRATAIPSSYTTGYYEYNWELNGY